MKTVLQAPTQEDVQEVLRRRCLRLVYQPIVDLRSGRAAGYECLARFGGPPQAGPELWYQAADEAGLGDALEEQILEAALARRRCLPPDTFLSINVSPGFLIGPTCARVLDRQTDLSAVVLEITERVPLPETAALRRTLTAVTARGALVAMDDAGTGYSGLAQLLAIRPALVKLDRALVGNLHRDEAKQALTELVGELVGRLDAWLLAEGIETVDELDACIRLGVPLGQGYLLGRPAPDFEPVPEEIRARVVDRRLTASLRENVKSLLEGAAVAEGEQEAEFLLAGTEAIELVVVLDANRRPVRLMQRSATTILQSMPMTVAPETAVTDAARRAMTRPPAERFLPLIATDLRGRYLGAVPVERLVQRLVELSDPV